MTKATDMEVLTRSMILSKSEEEKADIIVDLHRKWQESQRVLQEVQQKLAAQQSGKIDWRLGVAALGFLLLHGEIRHQQAQAQIAQLQVQGAETQKDIQHMQEDIQQLQKNDERMLEDLQQILRNQQQ